MGRREPPHTQREVRTPAMADIYEDGATYGPDPDVQLAPETPADPIYDDGAMYGADRTTET